MPKVPRDKESATPKKRTRKTAPNAGNSLHGENGNDAAVQSVTGSPEVAGKTQSSSNIEEQIRRRAYELYLERGGNGGSPEQDWLRAQQEICGRESSV